MEYKDYYKILGVERDTHTDEIKKKYRKLARKYHPDVSDEPNAEEKFKEVKEAYEVLKDPEKRAAYDQLGSSHRSGQGFEPPPGWEFHGNTQSAEGFNTADFSDFFANIFGGAHAGAGKSHQQRGQDVQSKIQISLAEAFNSTEKMLTLQSPELNRRTGQVELKQRTLKVKIPKGVTNGQQIRMVGQGQPGMGGGPNGDLYLEIRLAPHPLYTVKNHDVYLNLPVTPWEAALGASIEVPTLGGNVNLKIPAGSQTGDKMRLKGRGLPGKTVGDQYVLLKVYIPEPKDDKARALYQQMAEQMAFDPRQQLYRS